MSFVMSKLFINKWRSIVNNAHLLEILKGSFFGLCFKVTGLGLGYLFIFLIAKNYGAEGVGLYVLTFTYLSIGVLFAKMGLDINIMKQVSRYFNQSGFSKVKGIYLTSIEILLLASMVVVGIFVFLSSYSALYVFHDESLIRPFFYASFIIFPLAVLQFHAESLRGCKKISLYFIINNNLITFFSIIFLYIGFSYKVTDYDFIDVYFLSVIIVAVIATLIWLSIFNPSLYNSGVKVQKSTILKDSFPLMISGSLTLLMSWMDILMLGAFIDKESVGVYSVAAKLAVIASIALVAVNSIVAPKISYEYIHGNTSGLKVIVNYASKLTCWFSGPILVVLIFFPDFILLHFGQEFVSASFVLIILAIGQFINSVCGPVGHILNMTDSQKVFRNIMFIVLILNFFLNYLLIPVFGINGAAIATAVSVASWNLIAIIYIYKKMGFLAFYIPFRK